MCLLFLAAGTAHADEDMRFEAVDGDVTTNEYRSFIDKINCQAPPPTNNIGNILVYERLGGGTIHGLQTFYSFSKDRRVLDLAIVWSDAFLHARNDPATGRIVWTGKRELCWPNKETNDLDHVLYSGAENGDVIEHIVNTAKLILEDPSLWSQEAPPDKYGFGKSYLDRAKTYVRECQRSAETTIVPWYVRNTPDGFRLYHPDAKEYWKYSASQGPVPWNQQQCIVGGLLRLAQCHRLLNDGNTNIAYYEKITADAAAWFFSTALLVNSRGRVCYDWAYVAGMDIPTQPEDTGHSYYDVYVIRAYQANLGPTRTNMQRLINTARFVLYLGTNQFAGQINGTSNERRYERKFLNYGWIEMSYLDRELYRMSASAVLTSHEFYDNIPVQAAVLAAKHYWATAPPGAEKQEIVEDATGLPPVPQLSRSILQRWFPADILLLGWIGSELLLPLIQRFKSNRALTDRGLPIPARLLNTASLALGIVASFKFPSCKISLSQIVVALTICLFLTGIALRWSSIFFLDRRFRRLEFVGLLLAMLGLSLSFRNWASLLIVLVPCSAVVIWHWNAAFTPLLQATHRTPALK